MYCQTCRQNEATVSCRGQNLTKIPSNLPVNMTELDLSFNKMKELSDNMFYPYLSLETRQLHHNVISAISNLAFYGLNKLCLLNMSSNFLRDNSIAPVAFLHIRQLTVLALQNNFYKNYSAVHIPLLSRLRHLEVDVF